MDDILGKKITDIRCKTGVQDGWLDTAECYVELDHSFYIEIPYGEVTEVSKVTPSEGASTIFSDLSDIACYRINKEEKSVAEVLDAHKKRKQKILNRLRKLLWRYEPPIHRNRKRGWSVSH